MALMEDVEPVKREDEILKKEWRNAMKEEMQDIENNQTWEFVELPRTKKTMDLKRVFKLMLKPDGSIAKHKGRQGEGVDYSKVYAPVARLETNRLIVALVGFNGLSLFQLDVKSAFLYGALEDEVYVL